MKRDWIKVVVGKLAATAAVLLFLVLVPAVAAGSLPLWGALLGGAAGVILLNGACGMLLEPRRSYRRTRPVQTPAVSLRVVRGGRAA